MKHFWQGFENKQAAQVSFKRHVIMLFCGPEEESSNKSKGKGLPDNVIGGVKKLSSKYPTVRVKIINATKDLKKPEKHNVKEFPTVLLLKDGREVDRVGNKTSPMLLEQLFRKANS